MRPLEVPAGSNAVVSVPAQPSGNCCVAPTTCSNSGATPPQPAGKGCLAWLNHGQPAPPYGASS